MSLPPSAVPASTGPQDRTERQEALLAALAERILVLDGAMGTAIQALRPDAPTTSAARSSRAATRTSSSPGPTSIARRPPRLPRGRRRHRRDQHLRRHAARARRVRPRGAGARDQPARGAARARGLRRRFDRPERPRFVAGSMGPTTQGASRSPAASPSTSSCEHFREQALGPDRGRRRRPAARDLPGHAQRQGRRCSASSDAFAELGWRAAGRGLGHHRADGHDARRPGRRGARGLARCTRDLLCVGLNCATGPGVHDRPPAHARGARPRPASPACPNAGLPDEDGHYRETPEQLADGARALRRRRAGSTSSAAAAARRAEHIARARARWPTGKRPRACPRRTGARSSPASSLVEVDDDNRPADRRRAHQRARQRASSSS